MRFSVFYAFQKLHCLFLDGLSPFNKKLMNSESFESLGDLIDLLSHNTCAKFLHKMLNLMAKNAKEILAEPKLVFVYICPNIYLYILLSKWGE